MTEQALLSTTARRPVFSAPFSDWKRALLYMLTLSAVGLSFYPALLLALILLINSWRNDRYHFLLQLTILGGGYGLVANNQFPVHMSDLLFVVAIALVLILRKNKMTNRVLWATLGYFVGMMVLAQFSVESMPVQFRLMRKYMLILCFLIPLLIFQRNDTFQISRFFQVMFTYSLIFCAFYIIDGFILNGWILLPKTHSVYHSVFWDPAWAPFSLYFPRKYPPGLYILALCVYPIIYVYRLSWKQWLVVGGAMAACRTMTVIGGLIATYLLFQRKAKRVVLSMALAIIAMVGLYAIDSAAGGFLRISSTIDQFFTLETAKDVEDLAEFGSNRMAQVIPKMEMLYDQRRQWVGFGFIHPELSKNSAVQLTNDLYSDIEQADENVSNVEVTQVATILTIGYLGLILQALYYIALFFIMKPSRYAKYYLSTIVAFSIFGIGGFGGLNQDTSLLMIALCIGVVLLQHRQEEKELALKTE